MIRVKCDKCGLSYPKEAGHDCEPPPGGNDNAPFDEKAWRKAYMREYMKRWRQRMRDLKDQGKDQAMTIADVRKRIADASDKVEFVRDALCDLIAKRPS